MDDRSCSKQEQEGGGMFARGVLSTPTLRSRLHEVLLNLEDNVIMGTPGGVWHDLCVCLLDFVAGMLLRAPFVEDSYYLLNINVSFF